MATEPTRTRFQTRFSNVSRLGLALLIGLAGMVCTGCAGARETAVTAQEGPEVAPSETASGGPRAEAASSAGAASASTERAPVGPASSSSSAEVPSFEEREAEAEAHAIAHIEVNDLAAAEQALRPLLGEAALQYHAGTYLHHDLAWLAWAAGDYETALEENQQAREAHGHSRLIGHSSAFYRVSLLWQLAFLLLEQAAHTDQGHRSSVLAAAQAAIVDCGDAAGPLGVAREADLLTALYAQRFKGRSPSALQCDPSLASLEDLGELYAVLELCRGHHGGTTAQQALQRLRSFPPSVSRALFLRRAKLDE